MASAPGVGHLEVVPPPTVTAPAHRQSTPAHHLAAGVFAVALFATAALVAAMWPSADTTVVSPRAAPDIVGTEPPFVPLAPPVSVEVDLIGDAHHGERDVDAPSEVPPEPGADHLHELLAAVTSREVDLFGVTTAVHDLDVVFDFAVAAGKAPNLVMYPKGWAVDDFDPTLFDEVAAAGMLPMIGWEPWDHRVAPAAGDGRSAQPEWALRRLIDGHHDDHLESWARGLAEWGHPVVMRFAHEMNGSWYPWSESRNGNSRGEYVAAWRHVHDVVTGAGADNVIWVWSPNLTYPGAEPLAPLYPGDDYVDWIGLSGYWGHFPTPPTRLLTFDELFGPTIEEIRTFTDLPLLLTETGATEEGGFKAAWIADLLAAVAHRDDILGFVWFEVDKETDWRITSSLAALAAFRAGVADPSFGSAAPELWDAAVGAAR